MKSYGCAPVACLWTQNCYFFKKHISVNCVKKNQLVEQLILSIFCQPLHVLGISRPIIRRYNHICVTIGTSNPTWTTDSHFKRIVSTNCCIHKVLPPDTPETRRGWQNVPRISCASSWFSFSFTQLYRDARSTKR
jgi:hypothetical protein